ncbi:MAG: hypothetical protein WCF85_01255 [Rhodospirillaceae bacterium]
MSPSKRFNLRIEYCYRLTPGSKILCKLVLPGPVGSNDIAAIKERLEDGLYFIPGQVQLPDLCCSFGDRDRDWDPRVDQPWHEVERVNMTTLPATLGFDLPARTVIDAFETITWDETYRPEPKPVFIETVERF